MVTIGQRTELGARLLIELDGITAPTADFRCGLLASSMHRLTATCAVPHPVSPAAGKLLLRNTSLCFGRRWNELKSEGLRLCFEFGLRSCSCRPFQFGEDRFVVGLTRREHGETIRASLCAAAVMALGEPSLARMRR